MDWLEEQIEKIRKRILNGSLTSCFIGYMAIAVLGAFALYLLTHHQCLGWMNVLVERYDFWTQYTTTYKVLLFFSEYSFGIYVVLCMALAGKLFYKRKIHAALIAIREAAGYMAIGDLGHEISYHSDDEMGEICNIFEKMRYRLIREKKEEWENKQKQQEINGIFAHDVRTPLTVIKGYTEFLQKYVPQGKVSEEQLLEKLGQMYFQEERLIEFTKTMSRIQHLEERELSLERTDIGVIASRIEQTIENINGMFAGTIEMKNHLSGQVDDVYADTGLILEVFDNMISNAIRFAESRIEIILQKEKNDFMIYVTDDGNGFSEKALRKATEIYYGEEANSKEHFGIGLYASRVLCEKHAGELTIINSVEKGAVVAARFSVNVN